MSHVPYIIVALGAGIDRETHIGTSTFRAAAAAFLSSQHPGSLMIFSGGPTAGLSPLCEAEAMKTFVMSDQRFQVQANDVRLDTHSLNTAENVRNVVSILRALKIGHDAELIVIAGRRHLDRVVRYFRAYGFRAKPMTIRDALLEALGTNPVFPQLTNHAGLLNQTDWWTPSGSKVLLRVHGRDAPDRSPGTSYEIHRGRF